MEQILSTDIDLAVNQIEGAEDGIRQEEEAATLLSPTIPPQEKSQTDAQQYEKPTEDDALTAQRLPATAQDVPRLVSCFRHKLIICQVFEA